MLRAENVALTGSDSDIPVYTYCPPYHHQHIDISILFASLRWHFCAVFNHHCLSVRSYRVDLPLLTPVHNGEQGTRRSFFTRGVISLASGPGSSNTRTYTVASSTQTPLISYPSLDKSVVLVFVAPQHPRTTLSPDMSRATRDVERTRAHVQGPGAYRSMIF